MRPAQAKCAVVQKLQPSDVGYLTIFSSLLPSLLTVDAAFKDALTQAMLQAFNLAKAQLPVAPTADPYYFGPGHLAGIAAGLQRLDAQQVQADPQVGAQSCPRPVGWALPVQQNSMTQARLRGLY